MGVAFHLAGPLQKPPQMGPLPPHKFPELQKADLRHFDAGVSLDAPQEIGTPPGSQVVALGRVPEKAESMAHGIGLSQLDAARNSSWLSSQSRRKSTARFAATSAILTAISSKSARAPTSRTADIGAVAGASRLTSGIVTALPFDGGTRDGLETVGSLCAAG
jgi:hypothetical protein